LFLVPVTDLRFVAVLVRSVDDVLQFLQDESSFDFGTKRFSQNAQVSSVATPNVDEEDFVI
jgi:hypothetical protein